MPTQTKKQESRIAELERSVASAVKPPNGRAYVARTCDDIRANDPTLSSGMYYVDPDGQGVGDAAIYVYCNMETGLIWILLIINWYGGNKKQYIFRHLGSTSVLHNSEATTNVRKCSSPGCYSQPIEYSASSRQIAVLAELSQGCRQSIKVINVNKRC